MRRTLRNEAGIKRWDNIFVPEIRLEGKWLEELGFKTGQEIDIEQTHDRITITPRSSERRE